MAKRKKSVKLPAPLDPIDEQIARVVELATKLERAAEVSEPKWLAGMRRHYAGELTRLQSLKESKAKQ